MIPADNWSHRSTGVIHLHSICKFLFLKSTYLIVKYATMLICGYAAYAYFSLWNNVLILGRKDNVTLQTPTNPVLGSQQAFKQIIKSSLWYVNLYKLLLIVSFELSNKMTVLLKVTVSFALHPMVSTQFRDAIQYIGWSVQLKHLWSANLLCRWNHTGNGNGIPLDPFVAYYYWVKVNLYRRAPFAL